MKFYCNNCRQRYFIDDDKILKPTLRIRCKRCGHVTTVRTESGANDPASRTFPSLLAPDADEIVPDSDPPRAEPLPLGRVDYEKLEDIAWHYSIGGKSFGPFNEDDLIAKILSGQIGEEAYVWNPGMTDWIPAFEVPVFAPAIAEGKRRHPPVQPLSVPTLDLDQPVQSSKDSSSGAHEFGASSDLALASLRSLRDRLLQAPGLRPEDDVQEEKAGSLPDFDSLPTPASIPRPVVKGQAAPTRPPDRKAAIAWPDLPDSIKLPAWRISTPESTPRTGGPLPEVRPATVDASRASIPPPRNGTAEQAVGSDVLQPPLEKPSEILPEDMDRLRPGDRPVLDVDASRASIPPPRDGTAEQAVGSDVLQPPLEKPSEILPEDVDRLRPGDRFILDLEQIDIPDVGRDEPEPSAESADVGVIDIHDSHLERAFFDETLSSDESLDFSEVLSLGVHEEDYTLISSELPAVADQPEDEALYSPPAFTPLGEDVRVRRRRERTWKKEQRRRRKRALKAARKHPYSSVLSSGPHEVWRATKSSILQLKQVRRAERLTRWIITGGVVLFLLVMVVALPNLLGPEDERHALFPPSPTRPGHRLEASPPIQPLDLDAVNAATAIREAQLNIRISAIDALTLSDKHSESTRSPEGTFHRALEEGTSMVVGALAAEPTVDQAPGEALRITSRSQPRARSQPSQGHFEPTNGTSRYSRLQDSRTVRVTQPTAVLTDQEPSLDSRYVDSDYFQDDLPRIRRAVQRCHDLQLRESAAVALDRVELSVTVFPDGHVDVSMNGGLSRTVFGRCLRTRYTTWRFRSFEGEPVTLRQTFALQ